MKHGVRPFKRGFILPLTASLMASGTVIVAMLMDYSSSVYVFENKNQSLAKRVSLKYSCASSLSYVTQARLMEQGFTSDTVFEIDEKLDIGSVPGCSHQIDQLITPNEADVGVVEAMSTTPLDTWTTKVFYDEPGNMRVSIADD